jgi:plasmid stabilization system protein ParE
VTAPSLPVVFTATARRQVERAQAWWEENRPAAQGALRDELRVALQLVASQPACGAIVSSARFRGVRRILLRRVDYFLYYRVALRKRQVEVLAFWHARRGTGPAV